MGTVLIALVVSAWLGNHFLRGQLCTGAQEKVASVWNRQVKEVVGKTFLATGVSYAEDTVDRVTKILDSYTKDWAVHYTQACEATHVEGEQSDEVLDLRMGCLRNRLGELKALVLGFHALAEREAKLKGWQRIVRGSIVELRKYQSAVPEILLARLRAEETLVRKIKD